MERWSSHNVLCCNTYSIINGYGDEHECKSHVPHPLFGPCRHGLNSSSGLDRRICFAA